MKIQVVMRSPAWGRWGAMMLAVMATCAWGGLITPLYVGNLLPVLDQNGDPMPGSYESDPGDRARVEIRAALGGAIIPPFTNGAPHPQNPLLTPDSVCGIGQNASEPGLFVKIYAERPETGARVFARVFNAPTVEAASFYADSAMATVASNATSLVLIFGPTRPLDSNDDDGDGLINSWEKALGIYDRLTPDYDDDGMGDYHEKLAGTAPDDPASLLEFMWIGRAAAPAGAGGAGSDTMPVSLKWQSVPGKSYEVHSISNLAGEQVYRPVGEIVTAPAGEYELETQVEVPTEPPLGTFRLKLVLPEE